MATLETEGRRVRLEKCEGSGHEHQKRGESHGIVMVLSWYCHDVVMMLSVSVCYLDYN